jgi:hypothetical protein
VLARQTAWYFWRLRIFRASLFETSTAEQNFMGDFLQAALLDNKCYLTTNIGAIMSMDHAKQVIRPVGQSPWSLVT